MSNIIGLAGNSNSGKSTSLKYLDPTETFIISCTNKQLQIPGFRKKYIKAAKPENSPVMTGNWLVSQSYQVINNVMLHISAYRPDIKVLVIDDANYLITKEIFDTALTKGFEKFTVQALNYSKLIETAQTLRDDLTVIFISHLENYGTEEDPKYRLWTSGKMLTTKTNLDGLFSYLLYAEKCEGEDDEVLYRFRTRGNVNDTCRSVAGCFADRYIEPNMKYVLDTINAFENGED